MSRQIHFLCLVTTLAVGCVSIPLPIPHYSGTEIPPGGFHIVDANTNTVISEAYLIMVREDMGSGHVPPFVAEELIHFCDGDELQIYSERGVRLGVGEELANWQSRTAGFLVIATGYLPTYFPVDSSIDTEKQNTTWSIAKGDRESRAEILTDLKRQLEAKPITSSSSLLYLITSVSGVAIPKCRIHLSFWEIRELKKYLESCKDINSTNV